MIKKKEKNEKKPIEPVPKSIFHLKSVNKLLNLTYAHKYVNL